MQESLLSFYAPSATHLIMNEPGSGANIASFARFLAAVAGHPTGSLLATARGWSWAPPFSGQLIRADVLPPAADESSMAAAAGRSRVFWRSWPGAHAPADS